MKYTAGALISSIFILTSCVVVPNPGGGVALIPILPTIVELEIGQPYYAQSGYQYYYSDERWQYSNSRNGPWRELPRSHWPRQTRWKGHHYPH